MQDILCNMITWLVVILTATMIGNSAISNQKEGIRNKEKSKESLNDNYYTIQYGTVLKTIITVGLFFFLGIFIVNILTYFDICVLVEGVEAWTVIYFGGFVLFYLIVFSGVVIWRIVIDDDVIIYRNYLGITRKYYFSDISEIRKKKNGRILVYINNKKIFAIDNNLPKGTFFVYTAREKGIEI